MNCPYPDSIDIWYAIAALSPSASIDFRGKEVTSCLRLHRHCPTCPIDPYRDFPMALGLALCCLIKITLVTSSVISAGTLAPMSSCVEVTLVTPCLTP
jgi:hypothetical protein